MTTQTARINDPQAPLPARDWAILFGLSLLWAGSFFFYKVLAPIVPPFTLVFARMGLSALTLLPVLLMSQPIRFERRAAWRLSLWFLVLGLLNCALPFCLFAWSERTIPSGLAALLNAPTPIVTAVIAHVIRDERLTRRTLAGVLLGFAGVAVLIGPGIGALFDPHADDLAILAEFACVLATLSYAVGAVSARRLRGLSPLQMAGGQAAGGTVLMAPLAIGVDRFWQLPPIGALGWASLFGIAVLSTSLAYLLFFRLLASSGATRAALVTFLVPVTALLLGLLFLGEPVQRRDGPAIALIGLGLAVIDGRLLRRFARKDAAPAM
ncbi:DMT family transporter [Acetobacteraceae bacterium KSS8]|uniref:DMT family transporter n=1 Tax=Endosaccharibacter trunci TaxID=2812733 RepID=A0ABT1W8I4_9PROT|nr:DMT family transporter [Acetobacteraceae bacterium KSS8]